MMTLTALGWPKIKHRNTAERNLKFYFDFCAKCYYTTSQK